MQYEITIDGSEIKDWSSFHKVFRDEMDFFEGYGNNMNAWFDCMSDIFTNGEFKSLSKFNLNASDFFTINVIHADQWNTQSKEIFLTFMESYSDLLESGKNYALSINKGT